LLVLEVYQASLPVVLEPSSEQYNQKPSVLLFRPYPFSAPFFSCPPTGGLN